MCIGGSQLIHGLMPAICARQSGASRGCRHCCNVYSSRLHQTPPRAGVSTSPALASASGREAEQLQRRRQGSYHLSLSGRRWRRSIKAACTDGYADPPPASGLSLAGGQIGPGLQLACLGAQAKGEQLTLIVPDSIDAVMDMYIDNGRVHSYRTAFLLQLLFTVLHDATQSSLPACTSLDNMSAISLVAQQPCSSAVALPSNHRGAVFLE